MIAAFAVTSFVVPIVARRVTANDIELRVMSPIADPGDLLRRCVMFDRLCTTRAIGGCRHRVARLVDVPRRGVRRALPRPRTRQRRLQAAVRAAVVRRRSTPFPPTRRILTNNPQRVWWFTDREPTLMGFTRPRPGNSHYPLDARHTVLEACTGHAYLAWFDSLQTPAPARQERRPDLAALVDLQLESSVPGGDLYRLVPARRQRVPIDWARMTA